MNCLTVPGVHPGSPSRPRGQIQLIFGPMFSGKSTELLRRVRRFQLAQYRCLLVKYAKDTRYGAAGVSTHDRSTVEALPARLLRDVYQEALGAAVVGVDEGQFFPDIVEFCEGLANAGKTVIVAALDGTFQRKAFGSILNLVPLAESVVKLNAVCMECYREASYTKRLGAEREVEVIGGADKYHSVCRACYFRKRPQQPGSENKENVPAGLKQADVAVTRKVF
ncbi:thymidine kinase, cytosolic [Rhynochetos jubatus]